MRALCHMERLHRAPDAGPLLTRLRAVPNSRVGRILDFYDSLVVEEPTPPAHWPAPHCREPLRVSLELPGVRSKRNTPRCAIAQEAAARMHEDLAGRTHVFTDGSVLQDHSAAAACVAPELATDAQRRLSYCASSTTAELVGLQLAADLLRESPAVTGAAIFCDSRAALRQLAMEDRGPPLAQRVAQSLLALRQSGCDVVLQWLPSHVGIVGNEAADELAKRAHSSATPVTDYATSFDSARINFRRELMREHPDARIAAGHAPPLLPATGLSRRDRALLLTLRTGSAWPAERKHRLRGAAAPNCVDCGAVETVAHLLCECPALVDARKRLKTEYHRHGLPCVTLQDFLFPTGYEDRRRGALVALISFLQRAGLIERLF
ncbi:uncharacterized protein LOC119395143 [Rhipicephalus sanguineus]|uniref:uncharacterized protein LOC119395143 n=1 Tax=Rhipicephalus sanguineus TaxID=34632 RepID=UPI0018960D2C|nr:uncharacterized protein LOC119395143 [Rhipicephalus sanguineus]